MKHYNVLNLLDELQQLLDYKIVGTNQTTRIENLIKDAIEWLKVIPEGGVSHFNSFHQCWINEGYDPSWKLDNQMSMREYYKVIEILNDSSIRVVEEINPKRDLFTEKTTNYILGNLTDANITEEQFILLTKVGINKITVVNGDDVDDG